MQSFFRMLRLAMISVRAAAFLPSYATAQDDHTRDAALTAFDIGDYATARKLWTALAKKQRYHSINNLGLMHAQGEDEHDDEAKSYAKT